MLEGELAIDLESGSVILREGEILVIPKGMRHRPHAAYEAKVLLLEPPGVVNIGDAKSELTAPQDAWI